jgi:hypothetical protein
MASWVALRDMLVKAQEALRDATDKRRIDFQPYWDWYDGPRAETLGEIAVILSEPETKK